MAFAAIAANASAQRAPVVDFERDVQPILRARCVGCHGPDQQMGGLRLDRRGDALRGGSQTDIGPGNADGSRLYHRLIGTNFGTRMPPGGTPLPEHEIEIVKQWIDQGAVWPDAVSGEKPPMPVDVEAQRAVDAIRNGDAATVDAMLRSAGPRGAALNGRAAGGVTVLMAAALYGDAPLVKKVIATGVDVDATTPAGATALMWAAPEVAKMRLLLDAGADDNARSDEGRTALLVVSGIAGSQAAARLLIEYGADITAPGGGAALREAARVDDIDLFQLLLKSGAAPSSVPNRFVRVVCAKCAAAIAAGEPLPQQPPESNAAATAPIYDPGALAIPTPLGPMPVTSATIRAAVNRSLPLLQDMSAAFVRQTGCASCHHNSLVSLASAAARAHGYSVPAPEATAVAAFMPPYLESWRERALQNIPIAGGPDTVSYLLVGMAADGYRPDVASDAHAIGLSRRQDPDGRFAVQTLRPPIESNDVEVTAMSLRALQLFAPPTRRGDFDKAIARARTWLLNAPALDTEELAFKLLGLAWSKAPKAAIADAARELVAAQRDDGGWSQQERRGSDAYATGQALVALRESGAVPTTDSAVRRGVAYLLSTQFDDGTWFVETHSVPIQAYFESGFPFGVNQWISTAATAWATWALALAD